MNQTLVLANDEEHLPECRGDHEHRSKYRLKMTEEIPNLVKDFVFDLNLDYTSCYQASRLVITNMVFAEQAWHRSFQLFSIT